jgi:hypothetical protein
MANIKLTLDALGDLDLTKEVAVPLNYNLNDIRDIATRGGVWSKTVQIYGSNNNNSILGPIFDVNAETLAFNPKRKESCTITVDGLVVFEGIFQITKINKRFVADNWLLVYDCYLKSETSNFYTVIDGKFLTDIDLTEFNHTANFDVVDTSMDRGNWLAGYQYFLGYNPTVEYLDVELNTYEIQDLRPAVYAKIYWDKIFTNAGYSYIFDELYDLNFDKLIIPFNSDVLEPYIPNNIRFRAGIGVTDTSLLLDITTTLPVSEPPVVVPYQDVSEPLENWFDTSALFDTVAYEWVLPVLGQNAVQFNAKFRADPTVFITASGFGVGAQVALIGINVRTFGSNEIYYAVDLVIRYKAKLIVTDISGLELGILDETPVLATSTFSSDPGSYVGFSYPVNTPFTPLDSNDENIILNVDLNGLLYLPLYPTAYAVKVVCYIETEVFETPLESTGSSPFHNNVRDGDPLPTLTFHGFEVVGSYVPFVSPRISLPATLDLTFYAQQDDIGHFTNIIQNDIVYNSIINMNSAIPKKIKQTDFISAIVKMFNLYIRENPANTKELIIKTRDKFYQDGLQLDWSNKIDQQSIDVELLSNTQTKQKKFTYKDDSKDLALSAYTKQTNEIFGQVDYIFDNDFIKGESKIEPIFSPTIQYPQYKKNVPYIPARSPKNNIRILSVGDYYNTGETYWHKRLVENDIPVYTIPAYSYRHVGHLYPNSYNPIEDINYGVCDFYAHSYSTITNNNLYNRFYRTQYDIFENGYMMSAEFNLTYTDVMNLTLAERIYCNGAWWNINKIIDYDPAKNLLTKVELLSADSNISKFIPNNNVFISFGNTTSINEAINQQFRLANPTNIVGRISGTDIKGSYNFVQDGSTSVDIVGNFNSNRGSGNVIVGSNNKVEGSNIQVIGVNEGKFNQANTVNLGRTIFVSNFISAGRDEVLNAFPDNKVINIISAGRDEVRPLGSFTIENIISSGRDTV